jgi:hypothetical protein
MNERYVPIAWNAMVDLLKMVTAADGQERSETDAQLWLGVATVQRWRADEAVAAVVQIATTWGRSDVHRARILPGTVDEIIRNNRRQPVAFAAQQAALPPVDEATTDARRAAIAEFVRAQTTRMSVDSAVFDGGCDARGIRLDTPDVVCGHPAQDRRETDVPSGAHTHHDGDIQQQEETDHADDRMGAEAPAAAGDDERGDAAGSAAGRVGAGAQDGR